MRARPHVLFDFFGTLVAYSASRVEQGFRKSHELLLERGSALDYEGFLQSWESCFEALETQAQASLVEYSMDAVCRQFLDRTLPGLAEEHFVAQ